MDHSGMDMGGMDMSNSTSNTTSASSSMDMGMGGASACKSESISIVLGLTFHSCPLRVVDASLDQPFHATASRPMALTPVSMLWNWYTVDTCFLSSTWHNNTKAKFAGSVIGVFFLVIAIEGFRRLARDYDRHITKQAMVHHTATNGNGDSTPIVGDSKDVVEGSCVVPFK
jgi:hypothetical protein